MGIIIVAILLAVVAEIMLIKLYGRGALQFKKYDKANSDVLSENADEFVSKLRMISDLNINKVSCDGNKVNIVYKNNKYNIKIENGIASVEYDTAGCFAIKLSQIKKILKIFKFSKAIKKATIINSVMDRMSGKDAKSSEKEYKKINKQRQVLNITILAMVSCLVIGVFAMSNDMKDEMIDKVKSMEYSSGMTYGDIIDKYIKDADWENGVSEDDTALVEIKGVSIKNEKIHIQFIGELGMGMHNIKGQKFKLYYFEVDGESLDPDMAFAGMYEIVAD